MKPKSTKPDWLTGELLDAWDNYFAIRRSKRLMVNERIINSRMNQLVVFRGHKPEIDLVSVIDAASEGNGKRPWLKFYLPKGYVRCEEKPVQVRKPKRDTPEIKAMRNKLKEETKRIGRLKSWGNPKERALIIKLKFQLQQACNGARKVGEML